ncbi:MAG: barstar family protein [Clostridia bacterium]|nr:barstar family protein [Clostridia bacterium]
MKNTICLNLADCRTPTEIHRQIKESFEFPDFYGEN